MPIMVLLYLHLRLARLVPLPNSDLAALLLEPPGTDVSRTTVVPSQYIGVLINVFSGKPQLVLAGKAQLYYTIFTIYNFYNLQKIDDKNVTPPVNY